MNFCYCDTNEFSCSKKIPVSSKPLIFKFFATCNAKYQALKEGSMYIQVSPQGLQEQFSQEEMVLNFEEFQHRASSDVVLWHEYP